MPRHIPVKRLVSPRKLANFSQASLLDFLVDRLALALEVYLEIRYRTIRRRFVRIISRILSSISLKIFL